MPNPYPIIPADRRPQGQPGTPVRYPFGDMAEGDRFHVTLDGRDAKSVMSSAVSSARCMGLTVACRRISANVVCVVMLGNVERTS